MENWAEYLAQAPMAFILMWYLYKTEGRYSKLIETMQAQNKSLIDLIDKMFNKNKT